MGSRSTVLCLAGLLFAGCPGDDQPVCANLPPYTCDAGLPVDGQPDVTPDATLDAPTRDARVDATQLDGQPPDLQVTMDTSGPCVAPTSIAPNSASCDKQCADPSGDMDCDGLPDARDPWQQCNALLLNDDFAVDPATATTWAATKSTWSCGEVVLDGGSLLLADPALLAGVRLLVEARFVLGLPTAPTWRVRIEMRPSGLATRTCELWLDPTYSPWIGVHSAASGCWGTWTTNMVPDAPGTEYVLQAFMEGASSVCRLLKPDGTLVAEKSWSEPCASPDTERVRISTSGRVATFKHVRVFATP